MAIKMSYEDEFGVVHPEAYVNLAEVSAMKHTGTTFVRFNVYAGQQQRADNKRAVGTLGFEVSTAELYNIVGAELYTRLKTALEGVETTDVV